MKCFSRHIVWWILDFEDEINYFSAVSSLILFSTVILRMIIFLLNKNFFSRFAIVMARSRPNEEHCRCRRVPDQIEHKAKIFFTFHKMPMLCVHFWMKLSFMLQLKCTLQLFLAFSSSMIWNFFVYFILLSVKWK